MHKKIFLPFLLLFVVLLVTISCITPTNPPIIPKDNDSKGNGSNLTHNACVNFQCVSVQGAGLPECFTDRDCIEI